MLVKVSQMSIRMPPLQGAEIPPKLGKEGFGVKNSHFPPPQKRVFRVKKSPFSL